VDLTQDISAGVTSDPSQPEHPWSWAELSSSEAEVAVMLDDAILMAGTKRESRSPIKIRVKREVSLAGILLSQKLAGKEDLAAQLKLETKHKNKSYARTSMNYGRASLAILIEARKC
jgi:hypothetical protein